MATLFTTTCPPSHFSWPLKQHPCTLSSATISKHPFAQNTHLSFPLSSTINPKRFAKLSVQAEKEDEPSSSSSTVTAVSEKPELKDTQEGEVSGKAEVSKESVVEVGEREKQQELDWKTDEEFKKFMGNPSIEAAIKLEKKRADRKLKELDREKEMLEEAEETFKALDLNKVLDVIMCLHLRKCYYVVDYIGGRAN